jgi:pyrroloquinoline quinone biosynthesis protein E
MAMAGDAAATDPVCVRSPLRTLLMEQAEADSRAEPPPFVYRGR